MSLSRACGDPRIAEVLLEFRGSLRWEPGRFARLLCGHPSVYGIMAGVIVLLLASGAYETLEVSGVWPRTPERFLIALSAALAPVFAAYLLYEAYLTLSVRCTLRVPVVTPPHNPALLLSLPLAVLPGAVVSHARPELALTCAMSSVLPLATVLVMRLRGVRVVWCWRKEMDPSVLERLFDRLPGEYGYCDTLTVVAAAGLTNGYCVLTYIAVNEFCGLSPGSSLAVSPLLAVIGLSLTPFPPRGATPPTWVLGESWKADVFLQVLITSVCVLFAV
ncbi:hypothetical protein [Methanopyrus kandleri]